MKNKVNNYSKNNLIEKYREISNYINSKNQNVCIIGITKYKPIKAINDSFEIGLNNIGESYLQEAIVKFEELKDLNINWHFVGKLQTNKIKYLANKFSYIHGVYKNKHLDEICKRFSTKVNIFFEVNLGSEENKSGINSIEELFKLVEHYLTIRKNNYNINLLGLMCIPPYSENPVESIPYFKKLNKMLKIVNNKFSLELNSLSMGMTNDYKIAIEHGATHIRIGTLLYGNR